MAKNILDDHIIKSYQRWLDYARFHARQAGIPGEENDIINEVLCDILKKDHHRLKKLLSRKKNGYTELDFYILAAIKLNCHSETSPYRQNYHRQVNTDANINPWKLEIEEDIYSEIPDPSEEKLRRFSEIRKILESLDIPEKEKQVFAWKFFGEHELTLWPGQEKMSDLYRIYGKVKKLIIKKGRNPFNGRRQWIKEEITYLKINYPFKQTITIARALKRNYQNVKRMASRLGLIKSKEYLSKINSKNRLMNGRKP